MTWLTAGAFSNKSVCNVIFCMSMYSSKLKQEDFQIKSQALIKLKAKRWIVLVVRWVTEQLCWWFSSVLQHYYDRGIKEMLSVFRRSRWKELDGLHNFYYPQFNIFHITVKKKTFSFKLSMISECQEHAECLWYLSSPQRLRKSTDLFQYPFFKPPFPIAHRAARYRKDL